MSKKINIEQLIKDILNPEVVDLSICGKCSKCGECCSPFLPVCQEEIDTIQKYVIENNIKANKTMLIMQNTLKCPYHDGKKCMIYEVRPLICKEFYCYKKPDAKMIEKFVDKEYIPVNLWEIAQEFEKQRKEYWKEV